MSFQKAIYGDAATADNNWAYDWLPKLDIPLYDIIKAFEMMDKGEMNGYICQGFNPLQAFPDQGKIRRALGKLKFLVVMDPLDTETSRFWENFGPHNPSDPAKIQTEVFQLPTTCFAEENGALVNSARWLQWHWKAAPPPGEAQTDIWIMAGLFHRLREMYRKDGGAFPDPLLNLTWNYTNPVDPNPEELAKEMNGRALADLKDESGTVRSSRRASCSTASPNCATTARPCPAAGSSRAATPRTATRWRGATRPTRARQGIAPNWAWAWPANRRILYNRASADPDRASRGIRRSRSSNGTASKWVGIDVPDYAPTTPPSAGVGPFIMQQEGVGRLFARDQMVEGPFPEHYEPFESPIRERPAPKGAQQSRPRGCSPTTGRHFGTASGVPLCRRPPID